MVESPLNYQNYSESPVKNMLTEGLNRAHNVQFFPGRMVIQITRLLCSGLYQGASLPLPQGWQQAGAVPEPFPSNRFSQPDTLPSS